MIAELEDEIEITPVLVHLISFRPANFYQLDYVFMLQSFQDSYLSQSCDGKLNKVRTHQLSLFHNENQCIKYLAQQNLRCIISQQYGGRKDVSKWIWSGISTHFNTHPFLLLVHDDFLQCNVISGSFSYAFVNLTKSGKKHVNAR